MGIASISTISDYNLNRATCHSTQNQSAQLFTSFSEHPEEGSREHLKEGRSNYAYGWAALAFASHLKPSLGNNNNNFRGLGQTAPAARRNRSNISRVLVFQFARKYASLHKKALPVGASSQRVNSQLAMRTGFRQCLLCVFSFSLLSNYCQDVQNRHQGRFAAAGKLRAAKSWWSWSISCLRLCNSNSCASIRSSNAVINASGGVNPLSLSGVSGRLGVSPGAGPSISTFQTKPCGVAFCLPVSMPLCSRRLIVCVLTDKASAASEIVISMPPSLIVCLISWVVVDCAVFRRFGEVLA